ncbi:MAG: hypothetical protein Q8L90_15970 [Bacteroidota bacterium]|nr:hypothetical protein [Bacteroidota bacterium]
MIKIDTDAPYDYVNNRIEEPYRTVMNNKGIFIEQLLSEYNKDEYEVNLFYNYEPDSFNILKIKTETPITEIRIRDIIHLKGLLLRRNL